MIAMFLLINVYFVSFMELEANHTGNRDLYSITEQAFAVKLIQNRKFKPTHASKIIREQLLYFPSHKFTIPVHAPCYSDRGYMIGISRLPIDET